MASFHGILHNGGGGQKIHLPLDEVRVKVFILDVSARVIVTQCFSNPSDHPTSRALYCFPVPASAAICAFEMRTISEGRVHRGIAKEKQQARAEFEKAVREGRDAGLLECIAADVFTISIGSIPAKESVETKLVFVMSLMNDDNRDHLRFQLPLCLGQRYGAPPPALEAASTPTARTRVRITSDIQTSGRLVSVTSPSHTDIVETKYPTHLGRLSRRRTTVRYRSKTFLERDFVIIIHSEGLDGPRCFAELQGHSEDVDDLSLALQLTIIPNFKLPPVTRQEYLFLVDRSGSMHDRIETAKSTLMILLKMLPVQGTIFNIFSFGNNVHSLWPTSTSYDARTLDEAIRHVATFDSDLGGTEIGQAHTAVFETRQGTVPSVLFVFTDGLVHNTEPQYNVAVQAVRKAVNQAMQDAPVRVYALGIGDAVSSALCEEIAREGNGDCLYALSTESIVGKCTRLLRAGRTPPIEDLIVDWGIDTEVVQSHSPSVKFSSGHSISSRIVRLRPSPTIQQAPTRILSLSAGMRLLVFAIVKLKNPTVPKAVTLRGRVGNSTHIFELEVPIRSVQLNDADPGLPLVHTLAAASLIREHESNRAPLPQTIGPASDEERRKAAIVRLGEMYQLASSFTSFFVESSSSSRPNPNPNRRRERNDFGNWRNDGSSNRASVFSEDELEEEEIDGTMDSHSSIDMPGGWPGSSAASSSTIQVGDEDDWEGESDASQNSFTTLSSLEGSSSSWSEWSLPAVELSEEDKVIQRSPSPGFSRVAPAPDDQRKALIRDTFAVSAPPLNSQVLEVVGLQRFDGSFNLDDSLRRLVGSTAVDEPMSGVDSIVWATCLSIAFIKKQMGEQKELRDDLTLKASEFLADKANVGYLLQRAEVLLGMLNSVES
ncbi:hypothetical protein C8J56DRAFT_918310 [Mycena floridula]|nr:hypothetical protein C8J56DRAFT_918310 [Mycena floridula]